MTERTKRPMTPATQAALVRGYSRERAELRAERIINLARLRAVDADLARARKGEW